MLHPNTHAGSFYPPAKLAMRVILTVNYSPWSPYCGGGQQSVHNLALALDALGADVTVIYSRAPYERIEIPTQLPYRVRWALLPALRSTRRAALRPLGAVSTASVAARCLREFMGADAKRVVLHGNGEETALLPVVARNHRIPLVVTPRYPAFPPAFERTGIIARLHRLTYPRLNFLRHALTRADAWCPTSEASATQTAMVFSLPRSHCHVIPNGINPAFEDVERTVDAHRGPIVFFGRLAREKGVFDLLDAVAMLTDEQRPVVIVGTGESDVLARHAAALGVGDRVRFEAWMTPVDLARLLAGASLCVLPSWEESFGNTIAESMAAGVPTIATTAGSIPELVDHEDTGWLVPPRAPRLLAAAIDRLLTEPELAARLGARARATARARWSWRSTAQTYLSLYQVLQKP